MSKKQKIIPVIIVTGAAGFIGYHVCKLFLKNGYTVFGIDNFDNFYPAFIKRRNTSDIAKTAAGVKRSFQLCETDIRDTEKIRDIFLNNQIEAVIHLAARVSVRASVLNPELYTSVNVDGTINLLEHMKESGVKRLVFASSSSVYGDNCKTPFSERDSSIHPMSPYAVSKIIGEELCYGYNHLHGINTACLRFFTVFGPHQRPDLAIHMFVRLMSEGKAIPVFGDGNTRRDYTYISDILDGIYKAFLWTGNDNKCYDIFNLGRGNPVSLTEMIQTIAETLCVKPVIEYKPWHPEEVLTTCADISHAQRILSYKPRISFQDGIERFVDWYKNQKTESKETSVGRETFF
jgi:UDP-glucuronate 4-epimerase